MVEDYSKVPYCPYVAESSVEGVYDFSIQYLV